MDSEGFGAKYVCVNLLIMDVTSSLDIDFIKTDVQHNCIYVGKS